MRRDRKSHQRTQQDLERTQVLQAQQQALMDSIDDLAWLKDSDCRFVLVNKKFGEAFGLDHRSLVGKSDYDLSDAAMAAHYQALDREVMEKRQTLRLEERITRGNGEEGWAETVKAPVFNARGEVVGTAGVARDITERKRFQHQIEYLARHDPLTGLANRLFLEERFDQFIEGHPQFAVLFLDLDNFKLINDTDGHSVGDLLLRAVAQRLNVAIRPDHVLVRLGGDEFLILMPFDGDRHAVDEFAQRLATAISVPYLIGSSEYIISVSIGIAVYPDHGRDRLLLIKHADIAMYQAKKNGRNRFLWFHGDLASQTVARRQMEIRLRQALENEDFTLYYQPIIDTRSGKVIGAEALIRLIDKEKGLIPPATFIPLAEETGLIEAIGDWVLQAGLRQLSDWRRKGHTGIQLAVNISGIQFQHPEFADRVAKLLSDNAVPGSALELELTEGVLMSDADATLDILTAIKKLGVTLSVDDFGTGYSSLSYLKRLPIDRLKIDRSFVDDLPGHQGDVAITRSILHVATAFQLQVTAEGVEVPEQFDFLRELGCEAVQGYLFSRPVPAEEFEKLLLQAWTIKPLAA